MDRNSGGACAKRLAPLSLSARRAWIEILVPARQVCLVCVALRKESVDRNTTNKYTDNSIYVALRKESVDRNCEGVFLLRKITMSLSARRAWIEIWHKMSSITAPAGVALRKESVDRNGVGNWPRMMNPCRSPQGERG